MNEMNFEFDNVEKGIIAKVESNWTEAFKSEDVLLDYIGAIEQSCRDCPLDILSKAGREEIKSKAYAIAKKKTAIDNAGKEVKEEAQRRVNAINAMRSLARDRLEALQEQVRAPLTRWETQEKARVASCEAIIQEIRSAEIVQVADTAQSVDDRIKRIEAMSITEADFQGYFDIAVAVRKGALASLNPAKTMLEEREAERAELSRLRQEAEERDRQERERLAKAEAEALERRMREDQEKAKAEAAARAAEEARIAAEREAQRKLDEQQAAHEAALRKIKEEQEAVDRAKAEAEARAAQERARAEAEERRRQADIDHRRTVMTAAKVGVMNSGPVDEETARKIVMSIAAGAVPNVTIQF